jgi:MoaA/NifB/PqqE/SkfB family radical SAM enzyme
MITRKCNYRCRGCNVWREQDLKELSTEEVKRGLDILRELGVIEIVFSGGNPLLREDIGEILDYASRFFVTTVYDNGSIAAEKMDALRNVDFVAISLDSLDSRKNDYVKGVKGSWKKAMQTIEKLHANGIRVGVSPTISQFNLYEMVDFTNYFLRRGIPVWYCLYSYDSSNDSNQLFKIGRKNDEFVITDNNAMVELCDSLMDMERQNSNVLITAKTLEAVKNLYLNGNRIWKCRALRNFFIIDHLGRVAGCHLNKPAASIFDLLKVWDSEEFDALRRTYNGCSKCIYLCYIVYSIHGSVKGNLEIAKEKWRSAKLFLKRKVLNSLNSARWK